MQAFSKICRNRAILMDTPQVRTQQSDKDLPLEIKPPLKFRNQEVQSKDTSKDDHLDGFLSNDINQSGDVKQQVQKENNGVVDTNDGIVLKQKDKHVFRNNFDLLKKKESNDSILVRESLLARDTSRSPRKTQRTYEDGIFEDKKSIPKGGSTERRSETSTSRYQLPKDSAGFEHFKLKKQKSQEKNEYFDFGGSSYKNYKYKKVDLRRTQLSFLGEKPLDFIGRSFSTQHGKYFNLKSTENAVENLKKQKEISQFGQVERQLENNKQIATPNNNDSRTGINQMRNSSNTQETPNNFSIQSNSTLIQSIKQKLHGDLINSQNREYPFQDKLKVTRALKKLDVSIQEKFMRKTLFSDRSASGMQSFSKLANNSGTFSTPSQSITSGFFARANSTQQSNHPWISPLLRYESMRELVGKGNGSDIIVKHEFINKLKEQQNYNSQSNHCYTANSNTSTSNNHPKHSSRLSKNQNHSSSQTDGVEIKVLTINKALTGKGRRMNSLIEKIGSNNPMMNMAAGDIVKTLNKKPQYLRIVCEYNRILELDKNEKALSKTKRISTKMSLKIDSDNLDGQIGDKGQSLSKQVFIRETPFFHTSLRREQLLQDCIIHGITNRFNGISFDSYLNFYLIFLLKETLNPDILNNFIVKFLLFNPKSYAPSTQLSNLLEILSVLSKHPSLPSEEQEFILSNWQTGLQNTTAISYDLEFDIREKHIRKFFDEKIIDQHQILQLLFL